MEFHWVNGHNHILEHNTNVGTGLTIGTVANNVCLNVNITSYTIDKLIIETNLAEGVLIIGANNGDLNC